MEQRQNKFGLRADVLKWIALFAMLIDHIAFAFVRTDTLPGVFMHGIGRITMPVMCFFIAEGFAHSRNVKKYALRLLLFALVSQVPYTFLQTGQLFPRYDTLPDLLGSLNVLFTLLFGLLALWAYKSGLPVVVKILAVIVLCVLSLSADWTVCGVLFILAFGLFRGNFKLQALWFSAVSVLFVAYVSWNQPVLLLQAGVFLSLPLIYLYNGKRGLHALGKWGFYVFYPLHLLVLGWIRTW